MAFCHNKKNVDLLNELSNALSYAFMQRALFMAIIISCICAFFSCFIILKGWSLIGDAISHAVLPGITSAYLLKLPLALGAFLAGLFCMFLSSIIKSYSRVKEDAILGVIFSGMFALGLVMVSKIESDIHLMHILFGNLLGISNQDVIECSLISLFALSWLYLQRKDFLLICFDPAHASSLGFKTKTRQILLLTLLTLCIVSALKAAGIILVIAMLITPGATAFLISKDFSSMFKIATSSALISSISGCLLSYILNAATAPLIVCIQSIFFLLALFQNNKQRLVPLNK